MFLHDWADIFTMFLRALVETDYKTSAFLASMGMMMSWAYTRLYVFP